jgi:uncharacterized protein YceK
VHPKNFLMFLSVAILGGVSSIMSHGVANAQQNRTSMQSQST